MVSEVWGLHIFIPPLAKDILLGFFLYIYITKQPTYEISTYFFRNKVLELSLVHKGQGTPLITEFIRLYIPALPFVILTIY